MRFFPTYRFLDSVMVQIAGHELNGPLTADEDMCKVHLITEEFTAALDLEAADLNFVSTYGLVAKTLAVAPALFGVDPVDGSYVVTLKGPLGGWRWMTTSEPSGPITITGIALTSNDGTSLFGVFVPDNDEDPTTIDGNGQFFEAGSLQIRMNADSFS